MNQTARLSWTCLILGLVVLYMAWGGAIEFLLAALSGKSVVPPNPEGLHISKYGTIDYVGEMDYIYDLAGLALLFLSAVGLTLIEAGLRLRLPALRE